MASAPRSPRTAPPEALDRHALEQAGLLLLGPEWKRPLARLLGPYHPAGPRESLDPRLPFRWAAAPQTDPDKADQSRPVPAWVWPVLADLLHEQALHLEGQARLARRLSLDLRGLAKKGGN